MLIRLIFPVIFLALSGCTFHSSQLETVRSAFNEPQVMPEHYWLLQLADQKIPLVAVVDNPPFVSYVNKQGIILNHNGRDMTSVYQWPESDAVISISRSGNLLTHRITGGSVLDVSCSEWTLSEQRLWELTCQSVTGPSWSYRNEVQLDETGRIIAMHYAIWPGLSPIDLIWFPVSGEDSSILIRAAQ